MSPLIEEARRRQRRRRIVFAGVLLVAILVAALAAVLHRGQPTTARKAQPTPKQATVVLQPVPGGPVLAITPSSASPGESATVLRTLVLRATAQSRRGVRIDPKTGAVTVVTTTTTR